VENVLISIISLALIVVSTLAVAFSSFKSANEMANAWKTMEQQSSTMARTQIAAVAPSNYQGGTIDLTVQNDGQVDLLDYENWDVIIQYQSGGATYLTYESGSPLAAGEWTMSGIYVSGGSPEVFDPGILNPGEYMILSIDPDQAIGSGQMVKLTVSTPNGVTAQCYVTRQ
jgi:Archaebacterial flagellin